MRRNAVLSTYNRATYLDQIYLPVQFITRLNTCACVGAFMCDCTPLLKRHEAKGKGGNI